MTWIYSLIFLFSIQSLAQTPDTNIYLFGNVKEQDTLISFQFMKDNAITIKSTDLSFEKEPQEYRGLPLDLLIKKYVNKPIEDIVVIAQDQYILSVKAKLLKGAIVAFERNGQTLAPKFGGPYKLVFRESAKQPANAFCWYVKSIVFGKIDSSLKIINTRDQVIKSINFESSEKNLKEMALPIPIGHRKQVEQVTSSPVHTVSLADVITKIEPEAKRVILTGLTHRTKEYSIADLQKVSLVYLVNGKKIDPSHGGPLIAMNQIENKNNDNLLLDRVLFFLNSVKVIK